MQLPQADGVLALLEEGRQNLVGDADRRCHQCRYTLTELPQGSELSLVITWELMDGDCRMIVGEIGPGSSPSLLRTESCPQGRQPPGAPSHSTSGSLGRRSARWPYCAGERSSSALDRRPASRALDRVEIIACVFGLN